MRFIDKRKLTRRMGLLAKLLMAYFPIIITLVQLIINTLYFVNKPFYIRNGFEIDNSIGTSLIYSVFFVVYTFYYRFCSVSRITACVQFIFALVYFFYKKDDVYNISFQWGFGFLALLFTSFFYVKKYPNCKFSLYIKAKIYTIKLWEQFLNSLSKHNFNCEKALTDYQHKRKTHYENG